MKISWIKIDTNVFNDEKIRLIEQMPDADAIIVIWFKILCLAGKSNKSGLLMLNDKIAYTDEMLSTIFSKPIATIRMALRIFENYEMIEIIDNALFVSNWCTAQSEDKLALQREKTRKRVAKHREEVKQKVLESSNVTVTLPVTQSNALDKEEDIDKNNIAHSSNAHDISYYRFEEFWNMYDRKKDRHRCEKIWKHYSNIQIDKILSRLPSYIEATPDKQYRKHPATWLRGKCWNDEIEEKTKLHNGDLEIFQKMDALSKSKGVRKKSLLTEEQILKLKDSLDPSHYNYKMLKFSVTEFVEDHHWNYANLFEYIKASLR